jgi:hypothetical protein
VAADEADVGLDRAAADGLEVNPHHPAGHGEPVVAMRTAVDRLDPQLQPIQLGVEAVVLLDKEVSVAAPKAP